MISLQFYDNTSGSDLFICFWVELSLDPLAESLEVSAASVAVV